MGLNFSLCFKPCRENSCHPAPADEDDGERQVCVCGEAGSSPEETGSPFGIWHSWALPAMSANVHGKTLPLFGEEVAHESWEKITVLPLPFRTLDVTQRDGVCVCLRFASTVCNACAHVWRRE